MGWSRCEPHHQRSSHPSRVATSLEFTQLPHPEYYTVVLFQLQASQEHSKRAGRGANELQ